MQNANQLASHYRAFLCILNKSNLSSTVKKIKKIWGIGFKTRKNEKCAPEVFVHLFFSPGADGSGNGNVVSEDSGMIVANDTQEFSSKRVVRNGFWILVDMASGRGICRGISKN
ncbi:hypothetical protein V6N12_015575 [Hibiscus sabdariffa]|uniref:Uncharacterized protein n=1 Tax=Hibiscus sabdariffa TaxID=183260 RepID=A0ABR2DNJ4_9ROSI